LTLMTYNQVRKISNKASRWQLYPERGIRSPRSNIPTQLPISKLKRQLLSLSIFYLLGFYLTWPMVIVVLSIDHDMVPRWLWRLVLALLPFQGLHNFFVYVLPRMSRSKSYENPVSFPKTPDSDSYESPVSKASNSESIVPQVPHDANDKVGIGVEGIRSSLGLEQNKFFLEGVAEIRNEEKVAEC